MANETSVDTEVLKKTGEQLIPPAKTLITTATDTNSRATALGAPPVTVG